MCVAQENLMNKERELKMKQQPKQIHQQNNWEQKVRKVCVKINTTSKRIIMI